MNIGELTAILGIDTSGVDKAGTKLKTLQVSINAANNTMKVVMKVDTKQMDVAAAKVKALTSNVKPIVIPLIIKPPEISKALYQVEEAAARVRAAIAATTVGPRGSSTGIVYGTKAANVAHQQQIQAMRLAQTHATALASSMRGLTAVATPASQIFAQMTANTPLLGRAWAQIVPTLKNAGQTMLNAGKQFIAGGNQAVVAGNQVAVATRKVAGTSIGLIKGQNALWDTIKGFAAGMLMYRGILTVFNAIRSAVIGMVSVSITFQAAMANLAKVLNKPADQLSGLVLGFRRLSKEIPLSVEELVKIGQAAAQLGIAEGNIAGFVKSVANLSATAENLSIEDAASQMARFAVVTQMNQRLFENLASTVLALGSEFNATEKDILQFTKYTAASGQQVGMTQAQILGWSSAMTSVGLRAQAGGTAFSRVLMDMQQQVATTGSKLKLFAKVAGVDSAAAFQTLFKQDASLALQKFVEGLGKANKASGDVNLVLTRLGYTNVRIKDMLLLTAGAGLTLTQSLALASDEWLKHTRLGAAAAERYKAIDKQFVLLKNSVRDMGITLGEILLPKMTSTIEGLNALADVTGGRLPQHLNTMAMTTSAFIGVLTIVPLLRWMAGLKGITAAATLTTASIGLLGKALVVTLAVGVATEWAKITGMIAEAGRLTVKTRRELEGLKKTSDGIEKRLRDRNVQNIPERVKTSGYTLLDDQIAAEMKHIAALQELAKAYLPVTSAAQKLLGPVDLLTSWYDRLGKEQQQLADRMFDAATPANVLAKSMQELLDIEADEKLVMSGYAYDLIAAIEKQMDLGNALDATAQELYAQAKAFALIHPSNEIIEWMRQVREIMIEPSDQKLIGQGFTSEARKVLLERLKDMVAAAKDIAEARKSISDDMLHITNTGFPRYDLMSAEKRDAFKDSQNAAIMARLNTFTEARQALQKAITKDTLQELNYQQEMINTIVPINDAQRTQIEIEKIHLDFAVRAEEARVKFTQLRFDLEDKIRKLAPADPLRTKFEAELNALQGTLDEQLVMISRLESANVLKAHREEYARMIDSVRQGAGEVFDAMVSSGKGAFTTLLDWIKTFFLSRLKMLFQNIMAAIFTPGGEGWGNLMKGVIPGLGMTQMGGGAKSVAGIGSGVANLAGIGTGMFGKPSVASGNAALSAATASPLLGMFSSSAFSIAPKTAMSATTAARLNAVSAVGMMAGGAMLNSAYKNGSTGMGIAGGTIMGASSGLSIGMMAGAGGGPVGLAIGAVAGAIAGAIVGLAGGGEKRRMEEAARRAYLQSPGFREGISDEVNYGGSLETDITGRTNDWFRIPGGLTVTVGSINLVDGRHAKEAARVFANELSRVLQKGEGVLSDTMTYEASMP